MNCQTDDTNCEDFEVPSQIFHDQIPTEQTDGDTLSITVNKEGKNEKEIVHFDDETTEDGTVEVNKNKKRKKKKKKKKAQDKEKIDLTSTKKPIIPPIDMNRTYEEEIEYLEKVNTIKYRVNKGFVPNMSVCAEVFVNQPLEDLLLTELKESCVCCQEKEKDNGVDKDSSTQHKSKPKSKPKNGGFIPALKQMANVAALPGIVRCFAMPDVHSGYGFCIGNVAAFDMDDEDAIVSPGGIGFDINCGVRLIRTNLSEDDVSDEETRERLCQALFDHIPVGVGTEGVISIDDDDLDEILEKGIDWAIKKNYAWVEDKEFCEENGCMETADQQKVSKKAKQRGLHQIGTLGGGNHYAEVQIVDAIYDEKAAKCMGVDKIGQVCIMIHTGSRGLGHQVATDALQKMDKAMYRDGIIPNDRQLSCARINSKEGQNFIKAMSAAANYAWVNRSCITYLVRRAFEKVFEKSAEEMDMHLVYDVCHNVAKIEKHTVDGIEKTLLVHRKGSTRAFPPNHPLIPKPYQSIGQPALIGGTMGTCSYILVGTDNGMVETFGSTCHGAGRALSRNASRKKLDHRKVMEYLKDKNISIRVASPKLVTEEAPESYKDVSEVVDTCHDAGISRKAVKLRPIAVIKG